MHCIFVAVVAHGAVLAVVAVVSAGFVHAVQMLVPAGLVHDAVAAVVVQRFPGVT